jgi:hypothetical protein
MENILIDELPRTVIIHGEEWPIDWGYRASMLCEIDLFSMNKEDDQKMFEVLNIFYKNNVPDDLEEAMNQFLYFFKGGINENNEGLGPSRNSNRAYDFDQDASMIYAAFRSQYGINLNKTKNQELHWWEFLAMFNSLNEEHLLSKVMYWRTVNLKDVSKSEKKFVRAMKKRYAIKSEQIKVDSKLKLVRRNAKMKEYVKKRIEECKK